MKIYIGRDKCSDMDRIFISTHKLKYLSKSKAISQPQHKNWTIVFADDFKEIKKQLKFDMKHVHIPKVGEVYETDVHVSVFNFLMSYYQ